MQKPTMKDGDDDGETKSNLNTETRGPVTNTDKLFQKHNLVGQMKEKF